MLAMDCFADARNEAGKFVANLKFVIASASEAIHEDSETLKTIPPKKPRKPAPIPKVLIVDS
jgi:hypothetical protein